MQPFQRKIKGYEITEFTGGTKFRNGDTLLARITPCLENGKTAQVTILDINEIGFGSTEFIVLREKEGVTFNDFIYYLSISPEIRNICIKSMTGTSGRQRAQIDVIKNTTILLPPLEEQKEIANILSSLDEKIETNNQINKKLEKMAQAIFKQWFVDFEFPNENGEPYKSSGGEMVESELGVIPIGWEIKQLTDLAEFQNGYAFYKEGYSDSGIKVIDLVNVDILGNFIETSRDKYISYELYNQNKLIKYRLNKDDLIIIMTDRTQEMNILGKTAKVPYSNRYILNQRVGRIRVYDGVNENYLLSYMNSPEILEELKRKSLGTVQRYFNTNHVKELKFVIPSRRMMGKYSKIINPIYNKMLNNDEEINGLKSLRDKLLPKLMSGELRVPQSKL
ncbi:restriction endonuclease subunit S [Brevibacillus laterosporus]